MRGCARAIGDTHRSPSRCSRSRARVAHRRVDGAHNGRLDRSAARQSVLTAAALHGYSFTDLLAELPSQGGTWTGLANAYHRY